MNLKEALKKLPKQPGIYSMKNSSGTVIYVGKAKSLKSRVSQYFQKNRNNSPKVNEMVQQIDSFEYIITGTELEAFLLECQTIRKLKPRYNKLLKNCKGYTYLRFSVNEDYPGVSIATQYKKDGSIYFGPFTSKSSVENTLEFIKDYYPIKKCGKKGFVKNSSGCLNYQLGKCLGPCMATDILPEYGRQIRSVIQLLEGKDPTPLKHLNECMKAAAACLDFEKAIKYREYVKGVRHVINKQRIIKISKYGRSILAAEEYGDTAYKLFFIKGNKLLHTELISLFEYPDIEERVKNLTVSLFKGRKIGWDECMDQEDIDEAQIIYSYLKNNKNGIRKVNIPSSRIDSLHYAKIAEALMPGMRGEYDKLNYRLES